MHQQVQSGSSSPFASRSSLSSLPYHHHLTATTKGYSYPRPRSQTHLHLRHNSIEPLLLWTLLYPSSTRIPTFLWLHTFPQTPLWLPPS